MPVTVSAKMEEEGNVWKRRESDDIEMDSRILGVQRYKRCTLQATIKT
jgi:hypothetical protein